MASLCRSSGFLNAAWCLAPKAPGLDLIKILRCSKAEAWNNQMLEMLNKMAGALKSRMRCYLPDINVRDFSHFIKMSANILRGLQERTLFAFFSTVSVFWHLFPSWSQSRLSSPDWNNCWKYGKIYATNKYEHIYIYINVHIYLFFYVHCIQGTF